MAAGIAGAIRGDRGAAHRVERILSAQYGVTQVHLTDSGTSALTLAMLSAIRATGRNRVALPGYCCYDLVTALNGAGAGVMLYDIDPATLGPVWSSLDVVLEAGPAAVVVAHLFGLPVDIPRILEAAEPRGVVVIEDNAQGIGAAFRGRPLGTWGQLRVLSFGRGKGLTAGRGGALLVAPGWRGAAEALPSRPRRSGRELVPLVAQWLLSRPSLFRVPMSLPGLGLGDTVYRRPTPPKRISAVGAAVVEATWPLQGNESEVRRAHAARLLRAIGETIGIEAVRPLPESNPGWLRLPFVVRGRNRQNAGLAEARPLGVMPGYPRSLDTLEALPTPEPKLPLPGAAALAAGLWTLPTHSRLSQSDLVRLEAMLQRLGDRLRR